MIFLFAVLHIAPSKASVGWLDSREWAEVESHLWLADRISCYWRGLWFSVWPVPANTCKILHSTTGIFLSSPGCLFKNMTLSMSFSTCAILKGNIESKLDDRCTVEVGTKHYEVSSSFKNLTAAFSQQSNIEGEWSVWRCGGQEEVRLTLPIPAIQLQVHPPPPPNMFIFDLDLDPHQGKSLCRV